jgi:uncharacterized protein (DUF362 family)
MTVFFDKVTRYHLPSLQASIKRALEELTIDFSEKKSVFIKVNIVRPAPPSSCIVTHPKVVEALVNILRTKGINKITVGEGPAAGVDTEKAFKTSGYSDLAEKMRFILLDLNSTERIQKAWTYGFLELPQELVNSDFYINVSKMKTHYHTGVTLSTKSQQGILSKEAKKANHRDFDLHQSLIELTKLIHPDLVVIDAIHSMEGEGPTTGKKKITKAMVYGKDPLETDVACCLFMGVPLTRVRHLEYAIQKNLVTSEPDIKGEAFDSLPSPFEMPSPKPKQVLNFYSWKNYRACAEDDHSFEEAIHLALRKPKYWFTFFPKFFYFVLFKRFHLLRGKKARLPEKPGRVLCIGNCCEEAARKSGAYFVPGCPPQPEDILKTISRMK